MKPSITLLAATALVALVAALPATAATPKLLGTVGPGFTITLKTAKGAKVTKLKAGRYTFVVRDRSSIHDFALRGPVRKAITGVSFTGSKTVTLTLKKGRYTFVCNPHASSMRGSFTVF